MTSAFHVNMKTRNFSNKLASNIELFSSNTVTSADSNRRAFLNNSLLRTGIMGSTFSKSSFAGAATGPGKVALISDLQVSRTKLEKVPSLLENGEWDAVRTILKTPPLNKLWNLGESQNTLVQLAKETGEFELLELKDELAISLQICDQLTYDNAFVYFQPGNGKVKIKEPIQLAEKAMTQIQEAIKVVSSD